MDLFASQQPSKQEIVKDAFLLQGFALSTGALILADLLQVISAAPLRNMVTPGGFVMSVTMTNCGTLGWVTDRTGYRYTAHDPVSGKPWPTMPDSLITLAQQAASEAGFDAFLPDACLINQYKVGARMSLHQDKNELDFKQPIVSVSLGLPAIFQFGGLARADKPIRIPLNHGDGVLPLKADAHIVPALGEYRINLTFRKAG
ncbi:MAG TPA: DNA oxidative demethylase AlkB [Methylotenera sp.]|nr:DNA oxidative demethylase AlkB [Methylotenera sp.]